MNDAALIAVELRGAGDAAVRHPDELVLAIDVVSDAAAFGLGKEEEAAVFEGFGGLAGSEDCHVATVGERADSDDVAFCDERIHDGLVPWIHRHDLFHRGAGGFADHDRLHD